MIHHILRRPEVERLTGLSRSTIYRMMADGEFPKPVKLTRKSVGWPKNAVLDWLSSRQYTA